jgi:hypothetical protein
MGTVMPPTTVPGAQAPHVPAKPPSQQISGKDPVSDYAARQAAQTLKARAEQKKAAPAEPKAEPEKPSADLVAPATTLTAGAAETEPEVKVPAVQERLSRLISRERKLWETRKALDAEKAAIEAQKSKIAEWDLASKLAKENPLELMEKLGTDFETATKMYLERPRKTEEQKRIDDLGRFREETKKLEAEKAEKEKQQAYAVEVNTFKRNVRDAADPVKYEFLHAKANQKGISIGDFVLSKLEQAAKATGGKLPDLTINQILDRFESVVEKEARALSQAKKLQAQAEAAGVEPVPEPEPAKPKLKRNTLTNRNTRVTTSPAPPADEDPLKRKARIIAARFGGGKKFQGFGN